MSYFDGDDPEVLAVVDQAFLVPAEDDAERASRYQLTAWTLHLVCLEYRLGAGADRARYVFDKEWDNHFDQDSHIKLMQEETCEAVYDRLRKSVMAAAINRARGLCNSA